MSEPLYPVALRLRDRPVLVVGGGPVAARKVCRLLDCRARITLVTPHAVDTLIAAADAGALVWHARSFEDLDVKGQHLVFAATGVAAVDRAVAAAARAAQIWLNAADAGARGDLDLPALVRRGDLTVTVSTGGAAPGFAAELAAELGAELPDGVADYVALLGQVRGDLRTRLPDDAPLRQRAFAAVLSCIEARRHAEDGRLEAARQTLDQVLQRVVSGGMRKPGGDADE